MPDGREAPLGNELRNRIAERFLGSEYSSEALAWVAELTSSHANLYEVQDFITEQFRALVPSDDHRLLPTFR